ncbi:MAG: metallophosphoesterase [Clostridia bacterium]|nr:metallophosphoesterase [Clostridia bacterium]MDD4049077.1 metallophosphoesterase [Clostridia bacterium]
MKVGIIGDTHGSKKSLNEIIAAFSDVKLFLHTGDHWQDGYYLEQKTGIPVYTVKGNCDNGEMSTEIVFTLKDKKFFLTHGHLYGVKYGLKALEERAMELHVDYCIYGHTHRTFMEKVNDVWFLNPGSITWNREEQNYAGILLEYNHKNFSCCFLDVDIS